MANRKLSASTTILGSDVNPAADYLMVLDVSDTTDAASGTNKKVLASGLIAAAGVTASVAELNIMDGVTASATEINLLDGITVLSGSNTGDNATNSQYSGLDAAKVNKASVPCEFIVACSDLSTALTTGTTKAYFRAPYAFTLTAVRASLGTAQTSGNIFTVDINDSGATVLSTKLTIDNGEVTSTTAVTAAVISDSAIGDDALISIDIDQIGDSTAKGLIVTLIGTHSV